jgi:hypothetical protein
MGTKADENEKENDETVKELEDFGGMRSGRPTGRGPLEAYFGVAALALPFFSSTPGEIAFPRGVEIDPAGGLPSPPEPSQPIKVKPPSMAKPRVRAASRETCLDLRINECLESVLKVAGHRRVGGEACLFEGIVEGKKGKGLIVGSGHKRPRKVG